MRVKDGRHLAREDSSWTALTRRRVHAAVAAAMLLAALLAIVAPAGEGQVARSASLSERQILTGNEEIGAAGFGRSAAISADGSTAIIGGPADGEGLVGAAWVFARAGERWETTGQKLVPEPEGSALPCGEEIESESEECGFGRGVALSASGDVALIGSPKSNGRTGAAWVYTRSGTTWTKSEELTAGDESVGDARFGRSVALSADGSIAIVGGATDAFGHGAVWVFVHKSGSWERVQKLTARTEAKAGEVFFGLSLALSRDGSTVLVGAPGTPSEGIRGVGAAWLFTRSGEKWTRDETPLVGGAEEVGSGRFGFSVALSAEGTIALIGARTDNGDAGAAWAFADEGDQWVQLGTKLQGGAQEDGPAEFGWSVALSASGEKAAVGAPADAKGLGAAWLFGRSGGAYAPLGNKIPGEAGTAERDGFAVALSQTGAEALFGAPHTNKNIGAALALFGLAIAPPTVKSITPASGPTTGGTAVTIEGSGFLPGAKVTIGAEASAVEFVSESKLTARTGAHARGSEEVVVSDENGTSSGGPSFTYELPAGPVVTSINPPSGPSEGGTLITIEGTGFTPDVKVTICGVEVSFEFISETKLIARTPPSSPGACEVVVSEGSVSSGGGPKFTYEAPATTPGTFLPVPGQQVLGNTVVVVPRPVLAISGNIAPVSGKVYVRLPGTNKFVLLTGLESIPFGTIVDARLGTATVTTMGKKGLQSTNFYEGEFKLTQGLNGVATAALFGGNFAVCPTARERAHKAAFASAHHSSRRHVVRKLWANGHGTYSTKGNYATGAVLGTVWETIDRCNGTGIHVVTDTVLVTNLVTHKKVRVKAGHTYIAKAP